MSRRRLFLFNYHQIQKYKPFDFEFFVYQTKTSLIALLITLYQTQHEQY